MKKLMNVVIWHGEIDAAFMCIDDAHDWVNHVREDFGCEIVQAEVTFPDAIKEVK